ncbi:MAG: small-conductance mechanosensitive channel [Cellvibrionaceae bacterium]|jgi:small-conductance mechanosensitive channel
MFESLQSFNLTSLNWILFLIAILAWGIKHLLKWLARRSGKNPYTLLIVRLLDVVVIPLTLISADVIILQSVQEYSEWVSQERIRQIAVSFAILLGTYTVARTFSIILQWYSDTVAKRTKTTLDDTFAPIINRVLSIGVYAGGLLILLDSLQIPITPMLTSLGLSGLAVALALQPTLESFFAGLQVLTDHVVEVGDYVQLEGLEGYVIEIGWRSTRIQTTQRNLVIVPNSTLVSAIITNYDAPVREMSVIVHAGVSYESDLEKVERVSLEVMHAVIKESHDAVKNRQPQFGFESFGDSNINFWVWHYAKSKAASNRLTSLIIKRLHTRFVEEGIEMNYPVRKIMYDAPADKD